MLEGMSKFLFVPCMLVFLLVSFVKSLLQLLEFCILADIFLLLLSPFADAVVEIYSCRKGPYYSRYQGRDDEGSLVPC